MEAKMDTRKVTTIKASKAQLMSAFNKRPQAIEKHEYEERQIAKMLASVLPVEGNDYRDKVESILGQIRHLSKDNRRCLKYAYIFSRKAPRQEREDLYHELAIKLMELRPSTDKLAYAIARCDWKDFWKSYSIRSHYSFTDIEKMSDSEDGSEYGQDAIDRIAYHAELLVGESELDASMDAQLLYDKLPEYIRQIVRKRLDGHSITGGESIMLRKWVSSRPTVLAVYQ